MDSIFWLQLQVMRSCPATILLGVAGWFTLEIPVCVVLVASPGGIGNFFLTQA
ncbi:hypothetical protein RitSun_57 [Mycobacterium phage RitSun]|nr:hypothetical protein RitSun_57 [Mycobacterium phage RitSun]